MAETTNHKLALQIAVLEEKMNTTQAETESALDRLRADMADLKTSWKTDMADLKTDMADRKTDWKTDMADLRTDTADLRTDMARRDSRLILSVLGIMIAGITILGFVLSAAPAP